MRTAFKILAAAVWGLFLGLPTAQAEQLQYVYINIGAGGHELTVWPGQVTLQAGERYRFVVSNPSEDIHVVAAPELEATVKTEELRMGELLRLDVPAPPLDMTTGITLQPNQTIEWTFTPLAEGVYKFGCDDPVHAAAGMHAMIDVISQDVL